MKIDNEPNNIQKVNEDLTNQLNKQDNEPTNKPETNNMLNNQNNILINDKINPELKQDNPQNNENPNDDIDDINKLIQTELQNKINDTRPNDQETLPIKEKQEGGDNKKIVEESDNIIESLNLDASIDPNNIDIDSFLDKI